MILILNKFDFANKSELRIYSGHVEGAQVSPRRSFSLTYQEILSIRKESMFGNDFLFLETRAATYSVLTNQVNDAYEIISHKLDELEKVVVITPNGKNEEILKCRECGYPISKSTEVCPHCGAKTRYGDHLKKKEANKWEIYIELIFLGAGVFIVFSNFQIGVALIVGAIVGLFYTLKKVND
ncbi:MAG: zinc ribbon domain-containing protein [Blautia sp.]